VLITSKSDYGLRAALHLARAGGRLRLRDISEAQFIPRPLCAHIMRRLVAAQIVRSQAGPAGGYTLAQDPHDISVARVLAAADRDICIFRCVEDGRDCELDGRCALQLVLRDFGRQIADRLESLSLADLLDSEDALLAVSGGPAGLPCLGGRGFQHTTTTGKATA
jgi:Rrf2 family protein